MDWPPASRKFSLWEGIEMRQRSDASLWVCKLLLTAVVSIFLVTALTAQTDITGFWVFRVPTGDGNLRESFFDLKQNGETVTGKALLGSREVPISEGTFGNSALHFVLAFGNPPQSRRVVYDGAIEGDKISLTSQSPGRDPVKGTLERSKPEAALPPARLPLPELHDVVDNGLARTPPMGWNSWNKFAGKIDDGSVRGMADAMASSGMKKAGYIYVNIDDTWEGPRDSNGNMTTNRKFPDMKALADYVHSKGLKIGIYSSPGPKTCAGYEGSYGHEEQDAHTFAEWGIDYVKYDWCSAFRIYSDSEMRGVYQKMGDALRESGRPVVYSLCQYGKNDVWKWGKLVGGNLWRTIGDIQDNALSMLSNAEAEVDLAPWAEPGHWNDPDMLEIGNGGMSADEYRTHMTFWSILAAPLIAGNDLRNMIPETRAILTNSEVIAIDQDVLGKQGQRAQRRGNIEIWTRPLAGGAVALAIFNLGVTDTSVTVGWQDFGISNAKSVRDPWARRDLPAAVVGYSGTIKGHGAELLRLETGR